MPAVIIEGPMASGKTTHAKALAKHYGKTIIIDGVEYVSENARFNKNALVLTLRSDMDGTINIKQALAAAGIT